MAGQTFTGVGIVRGTFDVGSGRAGRPTVTVEKRAKNISTRGPQKLSTRRREKSFIFPIKIFVLHQEIN